MMSWNVVCVRYGSCPCDRQYRPVGTTLAPSLLEALDQAQDEFAADAADDETITVHCVSTTPSRFERI